MENLVDRTKILQLALDVSEKILRVNTEERDDKSYFAYGGTESKEIGDIIVYRKIYSGHLDYHLNVRIQNSDCEIHFSETNSGEDDFDEEGGKKIAMIKKIYHTLEKKIHGESSF
jgi:hypothetical protein